MIKNNKQQLLLIMEEAINAAKPLNNFPKLFKKDSLIQDKIFELRQIDENTFEVLGSPLSRAIDNQMRQHD